MIAKQNFVNIPIPKHLKIPPNKIQNIIKNKIKDLRNYFKKSGFSKAILGVSGGLDSAVSCVLITKALSPQNVMVALMPYQGVSAPRDLDDALQLARNLNIPQKNIITIPINKAVDSS